MLIIGEYNGDNSHKAARLEAGDILESHGACSLWLTTKHGLKLVTDKVGYPSVGGVLFLGGDDSCYFSLDPEWIAGAMKALEDDAKGAIPIEPFKDKDGAKAYIAEHTDLDPYFEHLQDLNNWTLYPESEWRSI